MAWCECSCGHHRADHPWVGMGAYGTRSGYAGCGHCMKCDRKRDQHEFVAHFFEPCPCSEYQETA